MHRAGFDVFTVQDFFAAELELNLARNLGRGGRWAAGAITWQWSTIL